MGLLVLILGLILFFGVHTLTIQRKLRAQVIAATGEAVTRSAIRWPRSSALR